MTLSFFLVSYLIFYSIYIYSIFYIMVSNFYSTLL